MASMCLKGSVSERKHLIACAELDGLRGLVTDMNWLAETDHGEFEARAVSEVRCTSCSEQGWSAVSRHPQARQVELSLQVSGDLADADLNLLRLSQALGNILGNAIPCTETGEYLNQGGSGKRRGTGYIRRR